MITHDTPNSTNIARLKYDEQTRHLDIEFRSGKTYRYLNVPMDVWNDFTQAPSAGFFFTKRIRDQYKQEKL
jgi:hypothetical protein